MASTARLKSGGFRIFRAVEPDFVFFQHLPFHPPAGWRVILIALFACYKLSMLFTGGRVWLWFLRRRLALRHDVLIMRLQFREVRFLVDRFFYLIGSDNRCFFCIILRFRLLLNCGLLAQIICRIWLLGAGGASGKNYENSQCREYFSHIIVSVSLFPKYRVLTESIFQSYQL
nr:MAG TPA: hypothetical protein [Caudoviricetes sp.]